MTEPAPTIWLEALYPPDIARLYRDRGYWRDQTIPEFLREKCHQYKNREAVVGASAQATVGREGDALVRLTYRQLEQEGQAAAQGLIEQGVKPGDGVLLQVGNTVEYLIYLLGIFWAGALPIFCLPQHRHHELLHFAQKTRPSAHVFSATAEQGAYQDSYEAYSSQLRADGLTPPQIIDISQPLPPVKNKQLDLPACAVNTESAYKSEHIAFLQLSGGTTGASKLIPRSHADYLYSVRESVKICQLTEDDRVLIVLPCAHNFTMSSPGILGAIEAGATIVLAADPSPQTSFSLIESEKITRVALVPPLAQAWLASAQRRHPDLSSLQVMQVGGAKLLPSVARSIMSQLGVRVQQVFGMAEGLVNYTRPQDPDDLLATTQGKPISPDDQVRIVDDHDTPVSEGESGHLLTRGPYTIRQYFAEEHANRSSFTADGYYRTGDLVRQHPSGYLEVTGRAKDQINRAGEKIAVDELEELAVRHPKVHDAVALGIPDENVGERIAMVLVPAAESGSGPTALEMRQHLLDCGLAAFKIPEKFKIINRFPLTNIGKISRRDLRSSLQELFQEENNDPARNLTQPTG